MFISLREAADLVVQMVLSVALVVVATSALAFATMRDQKIAPPLDVTRPPLWSAGIARIDQSRQLFAREDAYGVVTFASLQPATPAAATCSDAIGLRIACDLLPARDHAS